MAKIQKKQNNSERVLRIPDVAFSNRQGKVQIRFKHGGEDRKLSLNQTIGKRKIDSKTGYIENDPIATQLLLEYRNRFRETYKNFILRGAEPSIEDIKDGIFFRTTSTPIPSLKVAMQDYFDQDYGKDSKKDEKTIEKNGYMMRYVLEWLNDIGKSDISVKSINANHAEQLLNWVMANRSVEKEHSRRSVGFLERALKFSVNNGWIARNPFEYVLMEKKFKRQSKPITKFLTPNEVKAIEQLDNLQPELALIRDYFLFSCYTGMDEITLRVAKKEWLKDKNGQAYIEGFRGKPDGDIHHQFVVPICPKAEKLIEKFTAMSEGDSLLPIMTYNQQINIMLKCIAKMAGVNKPVSFGFGRKTFATTKINDGVRIEIIQLMMGHTSIKTTIGYYAHIDINTVLKEGLTK
ncbi:site-specific recombinase XerD [Arcicella aurantiaca]|uniref:Site-specific recombinase XerD n=1 Tax=Arcicella aurantiaca TaxID=591202 RepID=A0A316EE86_9BACT|nr:site-specific integrase [Arcicella aurantiaca]PWK28960.1 site-specific recombinase XerD [Arcicella aurantiaca]